MSKIISKNDKENKSSNNYTSPAIEYFKAANQNFSLLYLIVDSIQSIDHIRWHAKITLDQIEAIDQGKDINEIDTNETEDGPRVKALKNHYQEFLQAFFVRCIDNFEVYLVEILREVLRHKPEILISSEKTISLEYLIQFESIEALIEDVVESKVNSLSYKGFSEVKNWYDEKGIPLIVDPDEYENLIELLATRNIIVHNRGRIDEKYNRTVTKSNYNIGDNRKLSRKDFSPVTTILNKVVSDTDRAISKKFKLDTAFFDQNLISPQTIDENPGTSTS